MLVYLIDTAGIRKKRLITDSIEEESVVHSLARMRESDIVVYLVDIKKGSARQDRRLIEIALSKGKSVIVCLNKTDLVSAERRKDKEDWIKELPCLRFCDVIYLSAKTGVGLSKLLKSLEKTIHIRRQSIPTGHFNRVLQGLVSRRPISVDRLSGKSLKVKYALQVKNAPPTFLLYVNHTCGIPENYRRYLKKELQKHFGLDNTPIRLLFRQ